MFREWLRAQYHRGSIRAIAKTSRRWSVAIEFGTGRWGLIGGAAGSVTAGNGRFRKHAEERGPEGGNRLPFRDRNPQAATHRVPR
jgi:hypothetical protein